MSDLGHDDGLDAQDHAALDALVATLREAAPTVAELAPVRHALAGSPRARVPWLRLVVAVAALGLGTTSDARRGVGETSDTGAATSVSEHADRTNTVVLAPATDSDFASGASAAPTERTSEPTAAPVAPPALVAVRARIPERPAPPREEGSTRKPSDGKRSEEQRERPDHSEVRAEAVVEDTAPSPLLADALRAVAAGRCEEAAPGLSRVLEGETSDTSEHTAHAELALARCLFSLGYLHTSAAVADGIAQREGHPERIAALELLARLGERLPDPRTVVASVGHYRREEIERAPTGHVATLRYHLGRARYDAGVLDEAAALFASVPRGHRFYLEARYLEGMTHVRERHARPAVVAFESVLAAVGTDADGGGGERGRFRDLARLAIARVRYAAARPGTDGDETRREALLEGALEAWQSVPFGSEAGLDAFFEESWALYLLGDSPRALGHVHGLLAPQLRERPHPEALVLRATIYYEHCRFEAASATVRDFHARFDSLLGELEGLEGRIETTDASYALLEDVRAERGPSGVLGEVVRAALDDREIARLVVAVRAMDAERARLDGAPFRDASLGLRVAQELSLSRTLAVELGGRFARERLARVTDALRDRANEIDTVALEIDTRTRLALERGEPLTREPERPVQIVAVQGDQIWPFDGEYWEDELPYYRELVTDLCAR